MIYTYMLNESTPAFSDKTKPPALRPSLSWGHDVDMHANVGTLALMISDKEAKRTLGGTNDALLVQKEF